MSSPRVPVEPEVLGVVDGAGDHRDGAGGEGFGEGGQQVAAEVMR